MEISQAVFSCSAPTSGQGPRDRRPQVAVCGRSNVGKSSLINWMLRQPLARVAKEPGRTRALNYFLINDRFYLVDLPGYGFARVSQHLRSQWGRELGRYLDEETRLAGVVCLVDVRQGATPLDLQLKELLEAAGRRRLVVLTKADKVGRGQRAAMQRTVQAELCLAELPLAVSVRTGEGRRQLLAGIDDLLTQAESRATE